MYPSLRVFAFLFYPLCASILKKIALCFGCGFRLVSAVNFFGSGIESIYGRPLIFDRKMDKDGGVRKKRERQHEKDKDLFLINDRRKSPGNKTSSFVRRSFSLL